eukprot:237730-Pyramimonas_sp.AAC.1
MKESSEGMQEDLGPPFLHVWSAFIHGMGTDPNCPPAAEKILEEHWTTVAVKKPVQDLANEVRACRIRPTKKGRGKARAVSDHSRCRREVSAFGGGDR